MWGIGLESMPLRDLVIELQKQMTLTFDQKYHLKHLIDKFRK